MMAAEATEADFSLGVNELYNLQNDLDWPYVKPAFTVKARKWLNDLDGVGRAGGSYLQSRILGLT